MALSLAPIGVVFVLTYVGGRTGQIVVTAGQKEIKCRVGPGALDDMAALVRRFHELKLSYTRETVTREDEVVTTDQADGSIRRMEPSGAIRQTSC